ncbi:cell wall metabolism sensor histidine kinase WalK [Microbispora sp. H10836]|uniref:sensor histidine kinase n=1 Tax=Microbispora sp. H10836 TaxID=2729106 RepID=UPI001473CD83|nr:HAMP domain-containing sensor histidine kinase [Microbispora sp. H10836]
MRRRTLRSRLTLLIAAAVALAVAVAAAVCWLLVRGEMRGRIADSITHLRPPAQQVGFALWDCAGHGRKEGPRPDWDPSGRSWQVVTADGSVCVASGSALVTPTARERAMAVSGGAPVLRDAVTTDGTSVLVYTFRYEPPPGGPPKDAAQFAEPPLPEGPVTVSVFRSTAEMDKTLDILALVFGSVCVLGVLGAAVAGLWLARTALRPVERLTRAVEHVARTEDLSVTIPVEGEDEIARLSRSFNTMTAALSSSQERQRRLVADAGHELRTPLTSLRTNIDLLLRSENTGRAIEPSAKRRLLANVKEQFEEMSSLIGDLLELSRKAENGELSSGIDLHEVAASAVERARRRGPGLRFDVGLEPWQVHGDARGLQRAAVNVLDNAVKFSPPGGLVTVRLTGGVLTVRDEGPGIPEDELPHVFERFWRSPSARSLPGSGLGLAIVAQAVRDAGGRVTIENAPGGGTLATVELPGTPPLA